MPEIILPEGTQEDSPEEKINYDPTDTDEEIFFLSYHMHISPSESEAMKPDYRKWMIARFMAQKGMEREMMERHRLMTQIAPTL